MLRLPIAVFSLLFSAAAFAQADSAQFSYLLRLQHQSYGINTCVLLQRSGTFHLESVEGDRTRVAEGRVPAEQLRAVNALLDNHVLQLLKQRDIEEPLLRNPDLLQVSISRREHWQELIFNSAQSQEPYRRSLQPLLRWLNDLHKLPHTELSEEAGKNNCLVPRQIALKKRDSERQKQPITPAANPHSSPSAAIPETPSATALLRLLSMSRTSETARERCVLVNQDGTYRTEQRVQKVSGNRVETKIDGGKLAATEISELQNILADPALSTIRHRRTSQLVLPMSGEMLQLQIPRSSGIQDVVLSTTFNRRDTPFFYSGDADISIAQKLRTFLAEHVEIDHSGGVDPQLRNECTDAP